MPSPGSASFLPHPPRVRDQPLWTAAQLLMAEHPCLPGDVTRCANARCGDAIYPCTPARTATRLACASQLPFHKRMTALTDALACTVPPFTYFGLATSSVDAGGRPVAMIGSPGPAVDAVADRVLVSAVVA
jgi:hypothetical protein